MSKSIAERVIEEGAKVVGRAAGAVLSDRRGQEALARAVGVAQQGMRLLEAAQERALHAAGLAARPDYQDLRKQVARLKRKARELSERLEAAGASRGGADPLDQPPPDAEGGGSR